MPLPPPRRYRSLMTRSLTVCLLVAPAALPVAAEQVTLRMRGGAFEITGRVIERNAREWIIDAPDLGRMPIDATRFECISGPCNQQEKLASPAGSAKLETGETTWMGGSVIGTDFMPRLVRAYAQSVGATVDMQVGADPKNLQFSLADATGRKLGRVEVARQGVPQGFAALATGKADVVWASRAILPEEEQMMAAANAGSMHDAANQHVWALDAVVVVVAKENPVVSLSLDSVARIFAGQIRDWGELGLPPGRINVYAPSADMGTWSYFDTVVMRPRGLEIAKDAQRLAHATEWSDKVAADPHGIAINSIALVRKAKTVNIETSCGMVVPPSVFTAKTSEYPLARPVYFYTIGRPRNRLAAALLDFATSPQVQPVLKEARLVDQDPESVPFIAQSGRIAVALNAPTEDFDAALMSKLIADIRGARRLSLTYRFGTGGSTLDNRGSEDIQRLAALLTGPDHAGKTIMLLGFSDSVGRFDANLNTARRRAQIVRTALEAALAGNAANGISIKDAAYGELAPVACNDNDFGRSLNRRVEVWIK